MVTALFLESIGVQAAGAALGALIVATLTMAGTTAWRVRQHDDTLYGLGRDEGDDGLAGRVRENADRSERNEDVLRSEGMLAVRTDGGEEVSRRE
ncbi:hypothetical protein [Halomarina oriensis]|uniref:Uncharacterized protein n=1 Tax=Halomarina oriensis TaxID=671145 RepID=A0A6B0GHS9_9EURY|nr:hypothetical protein [Halomarina oriensis]MWG32979.1 hypothetical protein [Halomarina oriensis]